MSAPSTMMMTSNATTTMVVAPATTSSSSSNGPAICGFFQGIMIQPDNSALFCAGPGDACVYNMEASVLQCVNTSLPLYGISAGTFSPNTAVLRTGCVTTAGSSANPYVLTCDLGDSGGVCFTGLATINNETLSAYACGGPLETNAPNGAVTTLPYSSVIPFVFDGVFNQFLTVGEFNTTIVAHTEVAAPATSFAQYVNATTTPAITSTGSGLGQVVTFTGATGVTTFVSTKSAAAPGRSVSGFLVAVFLLSSLVLF